MAIALIMAVVFVAMIAACAAGAFFLWKKRAKLAKILAGVAAVPLLLLILVAPSFYTVDTGEVAVIKFLGEAKEVKTAGTYFDLWLVHERSVYDTKVQNVEINTSSYSSDAQTMDVAMTLQYQIMSDKAIDIAREYGSLEILQNRIESIAIEKTKSVLSSYKAMDIIATRSTMSPMVEEAIKNAIVNEYHVTISTVVLTNIDFSDAFEKAVEDKMIAEQKQLQAEYENKTNIAKAEAEAQAAVQKAEGQAQAKLKEAEAEIEIAKAKAEAKLIAAEADRKAQLEIAKAEAEAIQLKSVEVARSLGFKIDETVTTDENGLETIEYTINFEGKSAEEIAVITEYLKYIEYLNKWNGELPDVMTETPPTVVVPTP